MEQWRPSKVCVYNVVATTCKKDTIVVRLLQVEYAPERFKGRRRIRLHNITIKSIGTKIIFLKRFTMDAFLFGSELCNLLKSGKIIGKKKKQ